MTSERASFLPSGGSNPGHGSLLDATIAGYVRVVLHEKTLGLSFSY